MGLLGVSLGTYLIIIYSAIKIQNIKSEKIFCIDQYWSVYFMINADPMNVIKLTIQHLRYVCIWYPPAITLRLENVVTKKIIGIKILKIIDIIINNGPLNSSPTNTIIP